MFGADFFISSILLGLGLAMDAFSVSMANGLNEPKMRGGRLCMIAGVFALFQAVMPMAGWVCVHTVMEIFSAFGKLIPWISFLLLGYIGGKMLYDGFRGGEDEGTAGLSFGALLVQGVATSIDALSAGLTNADYNRFQALVCSLLIAAVTFFLCVIGVLIGKRFGTRLAGKASVLGGVILIGIGIKLFVEGVFLK